MAIHHFLVYLCGENHVYSSGDVISGHVCLQVHGSDLMATQITIEIKGTASTQFHDLDVVKNWLFWDEKTYHKYTSSETLLASTQKLFGDGTTIKRLLVGSNTFPFTFRLPSKALPNSWNEKHVNIRYYIQAHLTRPPSKFSEADVISSEKYCIQMDTPVDLNAVPGAGEAFHISERLKFPGLFFQRGNQSCVIESQTQKTGYVAGDVVDVSIQLCNHTNFAVTNVRAVLVQEWRLKGIYRGKWRIHKHVHGLDTAFRFSIKSGEISEWHVALQLPDNLPPTMDIDSLDIVKLEYYVKVTAKVNRCFSTERLFGWDPKRDVVELRHPLIVGTQPLPESPSSPKGVLIDFMDCY